MVDMTKVTPEQVVQVYSGKPGCGCGCRGAYSDKPGMVTRTLKAMRERPEEVTVSFLPEGWKDDKGAVAILALEDDTRYRWAYLREVPTV